jgi:ATP-dependent DNA helicase RecQ
LDYFGEQSPYYCGNCSNCLTEFEETDVSLEGRKIVSCVYRLKQRNRSFGKTMIIDILRGSKNQKILSFGLESLSTWGIMSGTSAQRIRTVLDCLIGEGILVQEDGEYPVVTMGNASGLLNENRRLIMKLPKERKQSKSRFLKTAETAAPLEIDQALLERLKKLRKEIASKEAVPAYIVFPDAALRDMCRKKPVSLIQFSGINGVGRVKLEKYGDMFTGLIRDYVNITCTAGISL